MGRGARNKQSGRIVLIRAAAVLAIVGGLFAGGTTTSTAPPQVECEKKDDLGRCRAQAKDPGTTGPVNPAVPISKPKERECTYFGDSIPCVTSAGVWNDDLECYLRKLDPQPPTSDPAWKGHEDEEGAIYGCYSPLDNRTAVSYLWLPGSPGETDQAALAREAVASMELRAIEIGLPVPDTQDHMIYVGAPVWLWTADPGPRTVGPQTATATAGAVTVTATARLTGVTWDMGDGTSVRCNGTARARGTVYKPAFGLRDSPTCGHRYQRPHKSVTITATSHWTVTWRGPGDYGSFDFDLTRSTTRPVGEIQAIVKRG